MGNIQDKDRIFLLKLARETINKKAKKVFLSDEEINSLSSGLKEKRGCFVTLTINKNLRGCIGYILPVAPLYKSVIENAYNAAYGDPRFSPVSENEMEKLHIEISVLSVPEKLSYKGKDDLLNKLVPYQDGVIIQKGYAGATFLPQVWEELSGKEDFLSHLCLKAGLSPNEWKNGNLSVEIYKVEAFEE
jgi:AmmeMemoRadiSam system protein A